MIWVYSILWLLLFAYGIAMLILGDSDIKKRESKVGILITFLSAYLLYDYFTRGIEAVSHSFFTAILFALMIIVIQGLVKFIIDSIKHKQWEVGLYLILGIMLAIATYHVLY